MLRGREQVKGFAAHAVRSPCAKLINASVDPVEGAAEHHVAAHV